MKKNIYNIIKCISVSLLSLVASCDMLPDEQLYDYGGADVDAPVASEQLPITGEINGYGYVDLGLPSGIKWAVCNVGAEYPWEYGGYYAWGETEEKDDYSWSTYKWCNGISSTMTKYCTDSSYVFSTFDNKTVLDPEDDVAHVKWGGSWRMPTTEEQQELLSSCTWTWTTQNGVDGNRVTGPNGNSIFLPAAGYRYDRYDTNLSYSGSTGYYWSGSLLKSYSCNACYLYSRSGYSRWEYNVRHLGYSVRPVCDEPAAPVEKYTVTVNSAGNGGVAIKDKDSTSAEFETGSTVTVVATPDEGYAFDGWYVDGNEEPVSTDTEYTFTVNGDITLVARFEQIVYEAVDLGLPSGVKWATFNVGATKPEEYGGYYAWGETEEKEYYEWSTYKWCNGSENSMTKYCTDSDYGTVDNKTVLDPEDDVAHVKWGGSWRMPTKAEQEELYNSCTWTWTTQNGVNGYKVTGPNGNSIFLLAAGYRDGTNLDYSGSYGGYWSRSLDESGSYGYDAYGLRFGSDYCGWLNYYRYRGRSVRPVCGEWRKYTVSVSSAGNGNVAIKDKDGTSAEIETGSTVTVVATPDEGYAFDGWYVDGNEEPISTDAEYIFTVNGNISLSARFVEVQQEINGHEYVDLGLPSGLKWATCNVGATAPEEYGGYYAWGETEEKESYDWSTYKWCNGSSSTMTKYCTSSSYGTVDNKTVLDPEDDVAHVKWGGNWRMPTKAEQNELRDNCTWTWTTENGVNGYMVTSKTNGNSIFLPAAGYRRGTGLRNGDSSGNYWSSSLGGSHGNDAYGLNLFSDNYDWYEFDRYKGRSVRPVYGEPAAPVEKYTVTVRSAGNGNVSIKYKEGTSAEVEMGSTVIVVATPDEGYLFDGWFVNGSDTPATLAVEYSFYVNENISLVAKFKEGYDSGSIKSLSQLDNNTIVTITSGRSFLMYSSVPEVQGQICSSTGKLVGCVNQDPKDINQQFRIVKSGGNHYLYSMGAGKYVDENGNYSDMPVDNLTLEYVGGAYPCKLMIGDNVMNSQVADQLDSGIVLNSWTETDMGNCYMILVVDADSE